MNINLTKYFPIIIACIVFIVFLVVHYTVPNTALDKETELVAERIIKDETGIDLENAINSAKEI